MYIKDKNEDNEYSEQTFTNDKKPKRDISCNVTNCNFTECKADGNGYENLDLGGALYGSYLSLTFIVTSCLFNNCSADRCGGAIYSQNTERLTCFSSNFTLCSITRSNSGRGGCICIDSIKSCCEINLCLFSNSSSLDSAGGITVGDVNITGCFESSPCSEGPINNCIFDNCSSNGNGGAMYLDGNNNIFVDRNLTFKKCLSRKYGGAIYYIKPKKGSFVDCKFEGNRASQFYEGNDVYLYFNFVDEVNPFISSYSSSGSYRVCVVTISNDFYQHFMDIWLPPFAKYVKNDGKNEEGCGNEENPCLTVDFLVKKASEVNESAYFLSVLHDINIFEGEVNEIHESSLLNNELSLIGRSKEKSKICVSSSNFDGNNLLSLENGTLSVKDLTFLINSDFDKSLIFMNDSGNIYINEVIFTSSSISNDYSGILIDTSSRKVEMEEVEFNSYNLSSTGRMLKCTDGIVSLSSITFININIERMTETAVYCSYGEESNMSLRDISVRGSVLSESIPLIKLYINGTLNSSSLNNIIYETTQEPTGIVLAFVCAKREYIPPLSSWTEAFPTLEGNNELYYKVELEEKNITFAYVHYIYDVLKNQDDEYVLYSDGSRGLSINNCGWKDLPCETLDSKYNNYEGKRRIIMSSNCLITSAFENVENELFIEGEEHEGSLSGLIISQIETEADYYFYIDNSNTHLNFTQILFNFSDYYKLSVCDMNELVSITNGKLSFYNCAISPSLPISFSKINIFSSSSFDITVSLQNIEYQSSNISLLYAPYSNYTSSSSTLNLNITNVTKTTPLNSLSNALSSYASVISLNIDHYYIIKGNVSCSSENCLNGGAICCTLKDNGLIRLNCLSVSDCKASASKEKGKEGRGGFLYLDCGGKEVDSFVFDTSVIFGSGNDATYGKNLFIKGNDFYNSINKEIFSFINLLHPSFENNMNDYIGTDKIYTSEVDLLHFLLHYSSDSIYISNNERSNDIIGCGNDDVPCKSISYGMNNLKEGEKKNIIVKGKVEIDSSIDLSGVIFSSFDPSEKSSCLFSSSVKMDSAVLCCILNQDRLCLSGLLFPLFSSFSDEINELFINSFISSYSELVVDNCEFVLSPLSNQSIINYSLISVCSGNLVIVLLNMTSLSFGGSFSSICFEKSSESRLNDYLNYNMIKNINEDFDNVRPELKRKNKENRKGSEEEYNNNIIITNSIFNNITKNEDKPSCLNIKKIEDTNISLIIDNTFIQCTSDKDDCYTCNCEQCDCNISSSSFLGISSDKVYKWNNNEELIGMICDWNEGMAVFNGGNANIKDSSIINSSMCGLVIKGGSELSLDNVLFDNNKRIAEGYKSARRNVVCESSSINLISLKEEKEVKSKRNRNEVKKSLWILNKECERKGLLTEYSSSFFIPSLDTISYSSSDIEETYLMNFTGIYLMPYNLSFEIRIRKEEKGEFRSLFGEIVRYFNETCCEGKFDKGEVGIWKAGDFISVVLHHGTNEGGGGGEEEEEPIQNTKKTSSYKIVTIVWTLVSVILFLILVLAACIITYLCCYLNPNVVKWREDRKRRGKKREHYDEIEDLLKKGNKEMNKDSYVKQNYENEKDDNKIGTFDNIEAINNPERENNMDNSDYLSYSAPQM